MTGRHAVQVLVDRAHQHLAPEAADGALGLAFFTQPVEHRDTLQIAAPAMLAPDGEQRARDGEFIVRIQEMQLPETPGEVQRRGQPAGAQCRNAASGLDEVKLLVEFDPVGHAQPAVKIHQVHAASQQHVLAIVDHFRLAGLAGKRVGCSASAQNPRASDRSTWNPDSPSAAAAASPARPPPITMAVGIRRE